MKRYDLLVVGGGIAGVAAAVSAARQGLTVLIVEKFGCLGGALCNSLVYPFMQHRTLESGKLLSDGIFGEIKKRHADYGEASWETFKFVFDDMVTEAGVDVLFHATVFQIHTDGRTLKAVSVATKSGIVECEARYFLDASGDGELLMMAGCDYQLGRESDGFCQPMTTCFRMSGVDIERFKQEHEELIRLYNQQQQEGRIRNPRENILVFYGQGKDILHLNTTRVVKLNPVDAVEVSRAEMEARRQVWEMFTFLKTHAPSCENAELITIANHIGVRESRKLKGVYILTGDDLRQMVHFDDTIAVANYSIDIHNPTGTGTTMYKFEKDNYYYIPYRSLLPKEYDNMLVAGRCLSADHEAHSAARVMPTCACMGEAAGTAFAVSNDTGATLHAVDVQEVRRRLTCAGAVVD